MKKLFLLFVGIVLAQFAMAQTIVMLDLPDPCPNVGMDEHLTSISRISFAVFPNPVEDYAFFTVDDQDNALGEISVELYDIMGRVLRRMEFYSAHNTLQSKFETDTLEPGVYIVILRCKAGVLSRKIIKR